MLVRWTAMINGGGKGVVIGRLDLAFRVSTGGAKPDVVRGKSYKGEK